MSAKTPQDARLFELFCHVVEAGLEYVRWGETGEKHLYIGTRSHWPKIQWQSNGLPHIADTGEGPKNYADVFGSLSSLLYALGSDSRPPNFSEEPSFAALVEYAKTQPRLRHYFSFDQAFDIGYDFSKNTLLGLVADIVDRYVHTNKTTAFERSKLLPAYLPIEECLFKERLPVTTIVPILFLRFDMERFTISEHISVEVLSDDMHLARGWHWGGWDNSLAESAATHGLFIRGQHIDNEGAVSRLFRDERPPINEVDDFFAAMRIHGGYATGYGQILELPVGWASSYTADLIPLNYRSTENYLAKDRPVEEEEVVMVTSADMNAIRDIFLGLQHCFTTNRARKVRVAVNRLNLNAMRTTDEDGIIDTMIAMEALLSDENETQEMTHKIALRLAALHNVALSEHPERAFTEFKQAYRFRSKIVHGSSDLEKYREIKRDDIELPSVAVAAEHLRKAFSVLMKYPTLLDPKRIDQYLITGKI